MITQNFKSMVLDSYPSYIFLFFNHSSKPHRCPTKKRPIRGRQNGQLCDQVVEFISAHGKFFHKKYVCSNLGLLKKGQKAWKWKGNVMCLYL